MMRRIVAGQYERKIDAKDTGISGAFGVSLVLLELKAKFLILAV